MTVGEVGSVEDAVFVDVDGNGILDVVSSCEGSVASVFVHWAPDEPDGYLDSSAWRTEELVPAKGLMWWMFCLPLQVDGRNGVDLIAGGKSEGAQTRWFEAPEEPRDLAAWRWHPLYEAGWIMSLIATDMDGDGDPDVLATDRRGDSNGCLWLENPGQSAQSPSPWPVHRIGCDGSEVLFATVADLDQDGLEDVLVAVKPAVIVYLRRTSEDGRSWESCDIAMPETAGRAKAVAAADINRDGRPDIVFTCEGASEGKSGVMWMSCSGAPTDPVWDAHGISGPEGVKYDLVEHLDLDADGDLDVLTCEERDNLGVFWHENPLDRR